MSKQLAYRTALIGMLLGVSSSAMALGDQWYLGIGGGASQLLPEAAQSGFSVEEQMGQTATVYFGRDFDDRSSGQFQLYALGDATFDSGDTASYVAGDASVLYRFYDSREGRRGAVFGASIYGRFGLGFINRESTLELTGDAPVYFGIGAGIETYFTDTLGIRLEALYQEQDTSTATLSLVTRFGGRARPSSGVVRSPYSTPSTDQSANPPIDEVLTNPVQSPQARPVPEAQARLPETYLRPTPLPETYTAPIPSNTQAAPVPDSWSDTLPEVEIMADAREQTSSPSATVPEATQPRPQAPSQVAQRQLQIANDRDNDGIDDAQDQCPSSTPSYPVDTSGCSSFYNIARTLVFDNRSSSLNGSARDGLNRLADLLIQYPEAKIEVIAHTDNAGNEQMMSDLARQRLRALGGYLVQQGVDQNRLLLRSFGGTRPVYDNNTASGRQSNNRIEVFENP